MRKRPSYHYHHYRRYLFKRSTKYEALKTLSKTPFRIATTIPKEYDRLYTQVLQKSSNVQMDYYFSLPNHQFAWFRQLIPRTADSIIGMCSALAPGNQFRGELLLTAAHHLAQRLEAEAIKHEAATAAPPEPASSERIALRNSYLANFAAENIKIIDMHQSCGG